MANYVLGVNGKLYYSATPLAPAGANPTNAEFNTAAAAAAAANRLINTAQDVNTDLSTDKADITTRGNNGWTQEVPTLKKGSIKFKMLWKPGDPAFTVLQTA